MMTITLYCSHCIRHLAEKGTPTAPTEPILETIDNINDNGIYSFKCPKGHQSINIISNIKFEMLFEYGLNAIADGYYRDGVSSIAAALERFYEFFIKLNWYYQGTSFEQIDAIWKLISTQSERQLGAYISSFATLANDTPNILISKDIELRNKVVHKGFVPDKQSSIDFAQSVCDIIEKSTKILKELIPIDTIEKVYEYYSPTNNRNDENISDDTILTMNILTVIDTLNPRDTYEDDARQGYMKEQIERILSSRFPKKISLIPKGMINSIKKNKI